MNEPRKALVVGIDDYLHYPLRGSVNDAVKIGKLLERHMDGSPNFEVKTLLSSNQKITQGLLKEAIDNLFSDNPSIALLYFAGHGFTNSYGGYLVTSDFKRYDEGVSMAETIQLANQSKATNKVILLDCCYSGSLAMPTLGDNEVSELSDGLTILTACREHESANEDQNGIFSSLLIEALEGQCADLTGSIIPSNIYAYIDQALGLWDEQRPVFKTNVSRFISLRKVTPPIDQAVLRKLSEYFETADSEYPLSAEYEFTHAEADEKLVPIFKNLQKLERVGLVVPVGEEHMYFAAVNNKSCTLTTLGKQYWKLIDSGRI